MRIERRLFAKGAFDLTNGSQIPCAVRIEQASSGRTFLYCERTEPIFRSSRFRIIERFRGHTTSGQPIETEGGLITCIETPKELCFFVRTVKVGDSEASGHRHELSLTNIRFPEETRGAISFLVPWRTTEIPVRLRPRQNYQEREWQLSKTRDIIPTAILAFDTVHINRSDFEIFIKDLCQALSLVQGRKTNWIWHGIYSQGRKLEYAVFGDTVTKTDTGQPLCFNPATNAALRLHLATAKEAVPAIRGFRETFDSDYRVLNAWLDARTEADYLESRTLKYVVVVEALTAVTTHVDKNISSTVHSPEAWTRLYDEIARAVPRTADSLTLANWQRLNAASFRDILTRVCDRHQIRLTEKDAALFSRIRNSIVHRFKYDYTIRLPHQWNIPSEPQASLHFFAADFVDRIVLQLFGLGSHILPQTTVERHDQA